MRKTALVTAAAFMAIMAQPAAAEGWIYGDIDAYLMERGEEIAVARSAAPGNISDSAEIWVFTEYGFEKAVDGTNGYLCAVVRSWGAPIISPVDFRDEIMFLADVRAPHCFDPNAVRTIWPMHIMKTNEALANKTPAEISRNQPVK